MPAEEIVCRCAFVTLDDVEKSASRGLSLEAFIRKTRALSGCGTCANRLRQAYVDARFRALCERTRQLPLPFRRF